MNVFQMIGQRFGLTGSFAKRVWASFAAGNYSDEPVTTDRAMTVMSFWRGVRLTAETAGTLPPQIFKWPPGSTDGVLDRENEYDQVARVSPNDHQTPAEFWEGMFAAAIVVGNGYALKQYIGDRLVALEPLIPDPSVTYPWRDANKQLWYRGRDWAGNDYPKLRPDQVFHLKGFGFGGDTGLSAIQFGAGALGMSIAANKVAGKTFASGLASSGFLETGQVLNEQDRPRLEKIMADYQADKSAGKVMILEGGMKFNKLGMTSIDAQLLETMGFNIEEVARLLGMPPILLGHSSNGQTMWGTGVEAIIQAWYTLGLRALITRAERAFQKRVIAPKDQGKYYFKLNVAGLLRGDSETQARIAASLVQNGLSNRDDQRAILFDGAPIPGGGGKLYTAQTNLAPLDMLGHNGGPPLDPIGAALQNMIERALDARADETRRQIDERLARARPN